MIHHCFSGWLSLCVCAVCAGYVRAIFIKESIRCQNCLAIVLEYLPYCKGILSIGDHSAWLSLFFLFLCRLSFSCPYLFLYYELRIVGANLSWIILTVTLAEPFCWLVPVGSIVVPRFLHVWISRVLRFSPAWSTRMRRQRLSDVSWAATVSNYQSLTAAQALSCFSSHMLAFVKFEGLLISIASYFELFSELTQSSDYRSWCLGGLLSRWTILSCYQCGRETS